MANPQMEIPIGFEVGTGHPVSIPLAHTFVTGQTQLSGKTTTLRALVARSGQRALAFVTKRGEEFEGRRVAPYLPKQGDAPIHWRLVETLLASAVEQKALKWERFQIINAAKGARSLEDVQVNVRKLLEKSKENRNREIFTLLDEYLELVLPQMRSLAASDRLDLQPGLNVMDLSAIASQTQAMVIRAALERINHHETNVLTVLPEAWEFAPRGRSAPAKDEAIAMARKGAAKGVRNLLLVDSQDIAGVDESVRRACSVWLLGVQRELNEVQRALKMMDAGMKKPKASDVAQLELGQFFACWGSHAVKVYVQPVGMSAEEAQHVAMGNHAAAAHYKHHREETTVNEAEARALRAENQKLRDTNEALERRIAALERKPNPAPPPAPIVYGTTAVPAGPQAPVLWPHDASDPNSAVNGEALYRAFKARLIDELPADPFLLRVLATRPELEVTVVRKKVTADGETLTGRIAIMLSEGWFDSIRGATSTSNEMKRRGWNHDYRHVDRACRVLAEQGFFRIEPGGVIGVPGMKVNIVEEPR
jgi:hypothetical protein